MPLPRLRPLIALLLLSGCTVGPDYQPPAAALPDRYLLGTTESLAQQDLARWWTAFGDPVLDGLIARAFAGNLDLQKAIARVQQARLEQRAVHASGGPTVDAVAQGTYIALGQNAPPVIPGSGIGGGIPGEGLSIFLAGFDASWEIDLFGGQRRANEAAGARSDAALWSQRDAEVVLAAEVANTYQHYRSLQRRVAVADATLASERELLGLVDARTANGLVTSLDARHQEREVAQLEAQRAALAAEAAVTLHALATLLGEAPGALNAELEAPPAGEPTIVEVPPGLPSELLLRRPDIRAAERQLAAATADIGAAKADLYPKISLTGALQLISFSLAGLIDNGGLLTTGGGGATLPLIGRGATEATVELRRAQADEALIAYRMEVLTALRDVEDALSRLEGDRAQVARLRAAVLAAEDAADTTRVRYRNGLVPLLDVLEAQQTALLTSDALIQANAASARDLVALYKALGGGWDERRFAERGDTPDGRNN